MLAKLRLDQTKKYEQAVAANEISRMLVALVEHKKHSLSIGAEQGGIKGWDDFVIQQEPNRLTHYQIKRQLTDFDNTHPCKKPKDAKLSALDTSFLHLAEWSETIEDSPAISHDFILEVPVETCNIKREIELRELMQFRTVHIKRTTTVEDLEKLITEAKDKASINIYKWLTTWCGFSDWAHILRAFLLLEIRFVGTEPNLDAESKIQLDRIFANSSDVLREIKSFIHEDSAYTGKFAPRQLLMQLKPSLLNECPLWTQIDGNGNDWVISGIHDLEHPTEIERPAKIVAQLWRTDRPGRLNLNISPVARSLEPIHATVFHLALHLPAISTGHCTNWDGWKVCLTRDVWTLGDSENDIDVVPVANNPMPTIPVNGRSLNSGPLKTQFIEDLNSEMAKVTWELVSSEVDDIIAKMDISSSTELRDAVETKWTEWKQAFAADSSKRNEILQEILHPAAEGKDILGRLRVGPKTKKLMAEAIHLSLLVSAGLDTDQTIAMQARGWRIGAIGLRFWSGPSGKKREVREIDDEECIEELIGQQRCEIMILPKSKQAGIQLQKEPLASSAKADHTLASGHRPRLLVTKNSHFISAVKKGTIKELRSYLQKEIDNYSVSRIEAINRIA